VDDYFSLERPSNTRRPKSQSIDQLLEESLAKVQKYLAALVEEDVLVKNKSKAYRQ
jgi:hypothetical protein